MNKRELVYSVAEHRGVGNEKYKMGLITSSKNDRGETILNMKEGANFTINGVKYFNMMGLLFENEGPILKVKELEDILNQKFLIPNNEAIYVIEALDYRSVIATRNLAFSIAKCIVDAYNATDDSDTFAIRLARANNVKIHTIKGSKKDYSLAAYHAGINDAMNPVNKLSDNTPNWRAYPSYFAGLQIAGHTRSLAIERAFQQNLIPQMLSKKDVRFWFGPDVNLDDYQIMDYEEFNIFEKTIIDGFEFEEGIDENG